MFAGDFHPYYNNSWALVIGINEYGYAGPLTYARNDAEAVASILITHLGYAKDNVALLTDKEATREAILSHYLGFINTATSPDDRVLFFFAGHGTTMKGYQGDIGYLVPTDGSPDKPSSLIRWDELTRNADLIPAKHILFILDACFSGLALKRVAYPGVQRFLSEMLQRRSRQVITAGKADEVVADGGGPAGHNSIFTGYLLEGFGGAAISSGGILTANGLMHYVYEKLAQDAAAKQTPHYGHLDGDGDFILIAPATDLQTKPELDAIVESKPETSGAAEPLTTTPPNLTYSEVNNYVNPSHPNFGRNTHSEKLGTENFNGGQKESKTFSWLAIVVEPLMGQPLAINLAQEAKRFSDYSSQGKEPFERFVPPRKIMTTINSVVLYNPLSYGSPYWANCVRIEKAGNLEFCESGLSYFSYQDIRAFRFVQIIGFIWQFMFFTKFLLAEYQYSGAASLSVNLVGTKDTILADFATGKGKDDKWWIEAGQRGSLGQGPAGLDLKCPDNNLQMKYNFVLASLTEQSSREIITDVGSQLGLAYNHQSELRCFIYGTDVYPWKQFFNKLSGVW